MIHLSTSPKRSRLAALALLAVIAGAAPAANAAANVANPDPTLIARWEPCEPNTGVTVIVDERTLGAGKVYIGCAPGEQPDGVQALEHAGFTPEGTATYGLGFICRIDGEPTPTEQSCLTTPGPGAYWSYWRGEPGGRWGFSVFGAASPESRSPINAVEGWSFGGGGAPRIEPMNGSGPSSFHLPAEQESSVLPARLARQWLAPVLDETAAEAEKEESEEALEQAEPELILRGAVALAGAGASVTGLEGAVAWLARSCEEKGATVEGCPLRRFVGLLSKHEEQSAARVALAVLGLRALGQSPSGFAGANVRGTLENMIQKTGQVKSEGAVGEAVEVTAPTVLALARTGTLSAKALKTLGLIVSAQNASTGAFEGVTSIDVEAVEALVAAREQGASVLGQSQLEAVETALSKAGAYLASIQEADGGVRKGASEEAAFDPSVESTARGAVGLALTGRKAASERAARWVSRYQVTVEYAGEGNRDTGEHTPAEDLIGAFLPSEAALRNALAVGVKTNAFGVFDEAQLPTIDALEALAAAGPYGPYDVAFAQRSLLFETRAVGSRGEALTATLTNQDVRSIAIAGVAVEGAQAGDFAIAADGCAGKTLAPGQSCEVSASFDPTASGLREAQLALTLQGSLQPVELPLTGTGGAAADHEPTDEHETTDEHTATPQGSSITTHENGSPTGSQGVLGTQAASPVRIASLRLDGAGAAHGLVGVSWRVAQTSVGVRAWTIAARPVGSRGGYVSELSGAGNVVSALLRLPPGAVYDLRITFTDTLGRATTTPIGRALVPYDDRASVLRYSAHWRRLAQPGAWLGTVSRGASGAEVALRLAAGRPVFMLRATSTGAQVEVRAGGHRQRFALAMGGADALREITAGMRARAGAVSLKVLKGMVDLDGVALL